MKEFFKKWSTVIVLSLALAIIIIDSTVLNVSLKNLIVDLNTDIKSIQTVITTYSLMMAAFLITGGRLGDLFGRKKMFLIGAAVFGVGSLIASFSNSTSTLLIGWSIIEGIGAAMMMPATSSLLLSAYEGKDRALAFGIWGGIAGASSALGPLLGGWITSNYSWRWAFRINPMIVVVIFLLAWMLKEYKTKNVDRNLDIIGVILSASGLSMIVYPIIQASTYGWWQAKEIFNIFGWQINLGNLSIVPVMMFIGILIMWGFFSWEKKVKQQGKTPLIDTDVFKNFQFSSGLLTLSIIVLGQMGLFFSMPVFLQGVKNLGAFETGKVFLPMSLTTLIVAPISAKIVKKVSPKYLISFGVLMTITGAYWLRSIFSVDLQTSQMIGPLILLGIGMGSVMAQISNLVLSAVSTQKAGEASGVMSTIRNIGASLGSAVIGTIFLAALSSAMINKIENSKYIPQPIKDGVVKQVNEDPSQFQFGAAQSADMAKLPAKTVDELRTIANESIVEGNKKSIQFTVYLMMIAFLASLFLPKTSVDEKDQDKTRTVSH